MAEETGPGIFGASAESMKGLRWNPGMGRYIKIGADTASTALKPKPSTPLQGAVPQPLTQGAGGTSLPGLAGVIGADPSAGAAPSGAMSSSGAMGLMGLSDAMGPTGLPSAAGPAGLSGLPGLAGPVGPAGLPGLATPEPEPSAPGMQPSLGLGLLRPDLSKRNLPRSNSLAALRGLKAY